MSVAERLSSVTASWGAVFVLVALLAVFAASSSESDKPNVLLIVTDDQGWGDVGAHGNPVLETPNLDQLAHQSLRFERFYVSPVCAPTRAALLTGRYSLRAGVYGVTGGREVMREEATTLAEMFRASGYRTGLFGKWHNGSHYPHNPVGQGFDRFLGFTSGHLNNYFDSVLESDAGDVQTRGYIVDLLTDAAIEFMLESRQPSFTFLSLNTPHSPFQVPDRYYDKYRAKGLIEKDASVYGMVENIDDNLGKLLDSLPAAVRRNTLIIFLSDNGPNGHRFNGDMRGIKASVYEGGVRVPAYFSWPARWAEGRLIEMPGAHVDLFPTLQSLLELKPLEAQQPFDGLDLTSILDGAPASDEMLARPVFVRWHPDAVPFPGSVREGNWRAVNDGHRWSLYNLLRDPEETTDVAASEPALLGRLSADYMRWWESQINGPLTPVLPEIGHAAAPQVTLQAHEAQLVPGKGEGVDFFGKEGWANDWISRWTAPASGVDWVVNVVTPGQYQIGVQVAQSAGTARLEIAAGRQSLTYSVEGTIAAPWIESPDRIKRAEVYERQWSQMTVGLLTLDAGVQTLSVRLRTSEASDVELKSLTLSKYPQ